MLVADGDGFGVEGAVPIDLQGAEFDRALVRGQRVADLALGKMARRFGLQQRQQCERHQHDETEQGGDDD
ncbi:hypothetical protein [Breoghania sp.]|uniref:hypothetical protein n=1 Tax=Breoghania sp. TaxID=2065378 RepID=UPI002628FB33|nr:hypothetical protein [Breoghania sp.]